MSDHTTKFKPVIAPTLSPSSLHINAWPFLPTNREVYNNSLMATEAVSVGSEITTELSLGLPGGSLSAASGKNEKKRLFSEIDVDDRNSSNTDHNKSQVVGWPPVCSYRRKNHVSEASKFYVKVSMDCTPYMRKIDLKNHKGYSDLFLAFEKLFSCLYNGGVLKDSENTEYTPIYEDKDGDWLLVGDVPWELFTKSCKRLRILKQGIQKKFN